MREEHKLPKQLFIVDAEIVETAVRRAIRHALLMHKRAGNPVAAWKDGKVVWIPAEEIEVQDETLEDES